MPVLANLAAAPPFRERENELQPNQPRLAQSKVLPAKSKSPELVPLRSRYGVHYRGQRTEDDTERASGACDLTSGESKPPRPPSRRDQWGTKILYERTDLRLRHVTSFGNKGKGSGILFNACFDLRVASPRLDQRLHNRNTNSGSTKYGVRSAYKHILYEEKPTLSTYGLCDWERGERTATFVRLLGRICHAI
jgi:hypothetical protein